MAGREAFKAMLRGAGALTMSCMTPWDDGVDCWSTLPARRWGLGLRQIADAVPEHGLRAFQLGEVVRRGERKFDVGRRGLAVEVVS
jgi:hypothetical protein